MMTGWVEPLIDLPPIGTFQIKVTLLLALAWLFHALLLRANPRWRVLLWRCTLVGLLAIPFAEMLLPELNVVIPREVLTHEPVTSSSHLHEFSPPTAVQEFESDGESELTALPASQPEATRRSPVTWGKEDPSAVLSGCWMLVGGALLLRLVMIAHRVRRAVRQAKPAPRDVVTASQRVAKGMGCIGAVDVRVMPNLVSPFLVGSWRPVIVVPERMVRKDQEGEWPAIFAHELAHHISGDILWLSLTAIAAAVFWFHPLAWRISAAHRRACEDVADAVAADYVGDRRAYSGTLARSALAMTDHMQAPGGLPMTRTANIRTRLAKIRRGLTAAALPRLWVRGSLVIGVIVLGLLGSLRLVQAQRDEHSSIIQQSDSAQADESSSRVQITAQRASLVSELAEIEKNVWRIVFAPTGKEVAFVGWERPVEILDSESFRMLRTVGDGRQIIHFAFSPDKDTVAFCENGHDAAIHNLRTDKLTFLPAGNPQPTMEFSPDGRFLATGGYGDHAKLFPIETILSPPRTFTITEGSEDEWFKRLGGWDTEGGLTVAFSPDGKILAVGNRNSTTKLFEVSSGKLLHTLGKTSSHELRFSPDGRVLAVAYVDGSIALWRVDGGGLLRSAETGGKEAYTVDWSPDGEILATAGLESDIILWDSEDLSVLARLQAPEWVVMVKFTPDGTRLLSTGGTRESSGHRTVKIWGVR